MNEMQSAVFDKKKKKKWGRRIDQLDPLIDQRAESLKLSSERLCCRDYKKRWSAVGYKDVLF